MLRKNLLIFLIILAGMQGSAVFLYAGPVPPGHEMPSFSEKITKNGKAALDDNKNVPAESGQEKDPFADSFDEEPEAAPVAQGNTPQITAVLEGIGSGGKDSYAIMNGDVYYAGEEKKGIKLLEVHKGWVDVIMNGGQSKLRLYPEEDLKKAQRGRVKNAEPKDVPENKSEK